MNRKIYPIFLALVFFFSPLSPADNTVVERLAVGNLGIGKKSLRRLYETWNRHPQDPGAAAALAAEYLELGRATADPRAYGRAEAALRRWWEAKDSPASLLFLQASLEQSTRELSSALDDLTSAVSRDPHHSLGWLAHAAVQMELGRFNEARADCTKIDAVTEHLLLGTCIAAVEGLKGNPKGGIRAIRQTLLHAPSGNPELMAWSEGMLAQLAGRAFDEAMAVEHFKQGMAWAPENGSIKSAYADFLLDRSRYDEVVSLLRDQEKNEDLLLRLTLAEKETHAAGYAAHLALLEARFAENRLRGTPSRAENEAIYLLRLAPQPAEAIAAKDPAVIRESQGWEKKPRWQSDRHFAEFFSGVPTAALPASNGYLSLRPIEAGFTGDWKIAVRDLDPELDLDLNGDGEIELNELRSREKAIASYMLSHLKISAQGSPCKLEAEAQRIETLFDGAYVVLPLTGHCPPALGDKLDMQYDLLFDQDARHRGLVMVTVDGQSETVSFSPASPHQAVTTHPGNIFRRFWNRVLARFHRSR